MFAKNLLAEGLVVSNFKVKVSKEAHDVMAWYIFGYGLKRSIELTFFSISGFICWGLSDNDW